MEYEIPAPPPPPLQKVKTEVVPLPKFNSNKAKEVIIPYKGVPSNGKKLRIIILSDTHNIVESIPIPEGDILIHAGDFTIKGRKDECKIFMEWIEKLPHKHKLVVCGNHEIYRMKLPKWFSKYAPSVRYLADEKVEVEGLQVVGCAWQGNYESIPRGVDILITHIPPVGYGDKIFTGESRGSSRLAAVVKAVKPKLHLFGHNHEGYGVYSDDYTIFVNAANCLGGTSSPARRKSIFMDYYPGVEIDMKANFELKSVEINSFVTK